MAKYKVLADFADKEDGMRVYRIGDIYPREGLNPSPARLKELRGSENAIGAPIIKAIPAKKKAQKK